MKCEIINVGLMKFTLNIYEKFYIILKALVEYSSLVLEIRSSATRAVTIEDRDICFRGSVGRATHS